jgi:hypothetical protein
MSPPHRGFIIPVLVLSSHVRLGVYSWPPQFILVDSIVPMFAGEYERRSD